uniref:Eukaryotic translation initiation factor 4E binding protein 1 n=1 Tax=Rattus norvegicus TaxID=10116 RepID=A0ABK0LLQ7_RAT
MSAGSSCSQTPSRAIPTRRVALGDGVQLPPGDYSTTPGGTLFSTTPGGRRGPGSRATSGAGGYAGIRSLTCDGEGAIRGFGSWTERTRGVGKAEGSPSRLPAFWVWWSVVRRPGCKLPTLEFSWETPQSALSIQIGTLPGPPCA